MAEVFSFSEGSAYLWTGNSTTSALVSFMRNVNLTLTVSRHSYRVPFAVKRTWTELERLADLNIGMAYCDKTGLKFLQESTGGQVHAHITHTVPTLSVSGGFLLYTGTMNNGVFNGSEGQGEQALGLSFLFERWTAY
jgi:hypothetical protein